MHIESTRLFTLSGEWVFTKRMNAENLQGDITSALIVFYKKKLITLQELNESILFLAKTQNSDEIGFYFRKNFADFAWTEIPYSPSILKDK